MVERMRAAWPALALAMGLGCSPAGDGGAMPEAGARVEREVRETLEGYRVAIEDGAWSEVGGYFADDARFTWFEEGRLVYGSRADVREALEAVAGYGPARLTYEGVDVTPLAPDAAHASVRFEQAFGEGDGGFGFSGVLTAVLVRGPDGWTFLHGHSSSEAGGRDG